MPFIDSNTSQEEVPTVFNREISSKGCLHDYLCIVVSTNHDYTHCFLLLFIHPARCYKISALVIGNYCKFP